MDNEGWIEWSGSGKKPDGLIEKVRLRNGTVLKGRNAVIWGHDGSHCDIVAYKPLDVGFKGPFGVKDNIAGDEHEALTFHPLPVVDSMQATPVMDAMAGVTASTDEPGRAINPKDAIGSTKIPMHLWPAEATALGALGMLEGAAKYGRNNFIAGDGVIASIYVDAAKRHLDAWFAGEECSHDVGGPHLGNALATIAILVKAQAHGRLIDDRDYSPQPGGAAYRRFIESITPYVKKIQGMFADKKPRHYTIVDTGASS